MIEIILLTITAILALLAVELKNLLHAIIALFGMSITIGLLFGILNAIYVMLFQFLVYAGVITVILITFIMFTERK